MEDLQCPSVGFCRRHVAEHPQRTPCTVSRFRKSNRLSPPSSPVSASRPDRAQACSHLFTTTTCDGVYTHGVARFPRFVAYIHSGLVKPRAEPTLVAGFGAMERWDGNLGPGNLNAWACMERAIKLSRQHGIGFVALRNTNHWMRAGTYGWQAAEAGLIGICWTNTMPNMPAWGGWMRASATIRSSLPSPAKGPVVARHGGFAILLRRHRGYKLRGELLPVDGGFDRKATSPAIPQPLRSRFARCRRLLEGLGPSVVLDMVAAMTSLDARPIGFPAIHAGDRHLTNIHRHQSTALGPATEAEQMADAS